MADDQVIELLGQIREKLGTTEPDAIDELLGLILVKLLDLEKRVGELQSRE